MNRATFAFAAAAILAAGLPATARSQVSIESPRACLGQLVVDAATGAARFGRTDGTSTLQVVYNSFTAPSYYGVVGSNNSVVWGDSVLLARSGTLEAITFALDNSILSNATLDSATLAIQIEDPATNALLGSWTVEANFVPYGGLPKGYYVLIGISGLSSQAISVGGWLVVKQRVVSSPNFPPGGLGVISLSPPGVGSSPPSMYSTEASGFFTLPEVTLDVAYRLDADVVDAAEPVSWGRMKRLYR